MSVTVIKRLDQKQRRKEGFISVGSSRVPSIFEGKSRHTLRHALSLNVAVDLHLYQMQSRAMTVGTTEDHREDSVGKDMQ